MLRALHRLLLSVKSETSPLAPIHLFVTRDATVEIAYGAQFTNRSSGAQSYRPIRVLEYSFSTGVVAALAILVYDILLTTDEEVRLIWPYVFLLISMVTEAHWRLSRKRLSYTKLLYFFIRYFPVLVLMSVYILLFIIMLHTDV